MISSIVKNYFKYILNIIKKFEAMKYYQSIKHISLLFALINVNKVFEKENKQIEKWRKVTKLIFPSPFINYHHFITIIGMYETKSNHKNISNF